MFKKLEEVEARFEELSQILSDPEVLADQSQFQKYASLLRLWNKDMNLTAIHNLSGIVRQHFTDSLALRKFIDLNKTKSMV